MAFSFVFQFHSSVFRVNFCFLGNGGRSLRYDKRYVALPSPLTAVMFWRICLDEAQMVESTTAKVRTFYYQTCLVLTKFILKYELKEVMSWFVHLEKFQPTFFKFIIL